MRHAQPAPPHKAPPAAARMNPPSPQSSAPQPWATGTALQFRAADPGGAVAAFARSHADCTARAGNRTGLPDRLKSGMESLSGIALDDVRVHRNSARPAQLQALAHTQGSEIHLGPGQERHLPHEAWHVVQQKQGRVRPTMQLGGTAINDDAGLEREADTMGARAFSSAAPAQRAVARQTRAPLDPPLQAVWRNTSLNEEYYQWDKPLAGLRWYLSKTGPDMYFIVENPNAQNRHVIPRQGTLATFDQWVESGLFSPIEADSSIDESPPVAPDRSSMNAKAYRPYVFGPVKHAFKGGRFQVSTAHYEKLDQDAFEGATGTAFSKPGSALKPGDTHPSLKQARNVGRYVYHLTTLRNLMMSPDTNDVKRGIFATGLDPSKGGGKGGASETSAVMKNEKLTTDSFRHSTGVVAVTTSATNIKMYASQRTEHTAEEFAAKDLPEEELMAREPVLLRFAITQAYHDAMEEDPVHSKDKTVRLIRGQLIAPDEIEALTSDGWQPLAALAKQIYTMFGMD